ncbi:MAG: uracil-DNA glycosylase [Burkholderiaceae bacterium]
MSPAIDTAALVDYAALAPGWQSLVERFLESADGRRLQEFLAMRRASGARIYPPRPLSALEITPFDEVRVVILGQDPYYGEGQANGLAFSVPSGVRPPPSLRNILHEVERDLGCTPPPGSLQTWARQGVLLLNAVLTVEDGEPNSHANQGWEILSAALIDSLVNDQRPKVFLLWGSYAQRLGRGVELPHLALWANHPSPLAARRPPRPFIGCGHFSEANEFLRRNGRGAIDWCTGTPWQP